MKITCISDLHGQYPKLEGGDLLIIAGDMTSENNKSSWYKFFEWMHEQDYKKVIYIGGNHDQYLAQSISHEEQGNIYSFCKDNDLNPDENLIYLCDSGYKYQSLNIWGTPRSLYFRGINPLCNFFTGTEKELERYYKLIPSNTDILVSHSPPYGIFDEIRDRKTGKMINCGSMMLRYKIDVVRPRIVIFGHIHEHGGKHQVIEGIHYINASIVDENYDHAFKPINIEM